MKQKLFSIFCCLLLSANLFAGQYYYSNNFTNTSATKSWNDVSINALVDQGNPYVVYEYTFAGSYPHVVLTICFEKSRGTTINGNLYPPAGTYTIRTNSSSYQLTQDLTLGDGYAGDSYFWSYALDHYDYGDAPMASFIEGTVKVAAGAGEPYITVSVSNSTIYRYNISSKSTSDRNYNQQFSLSYTIGSPAVAGTVTASANPEEGGDVTVSPSGPLAGGTAVTLTPQANSGYAFLGWADGGNANPRIVYVNGTTNYVANFATARTITVTSDDASKGSATGGGTFAEGSTTVITATANPGYSFAYWDDGNTDATRTITVSADKLTYTAYFEEYTSSMSIVSCSSGADIEAHFDYSNVTITYYNSNSYFVDATCDNYMYVSQVSASNFNNDKLNLYFTLPYRDISVH